MESFEKKIDAKLVLSILAAGIMSFSGVVVETAMNVTFPTLMKEFGIGTSTVQWITTGYLLILAVIIPASSYLKKRFTTKALFVTAISLFIVGTVMAAVTPVFSLLLVGRLIQGVGTGIALPLMFNIVLEQVPEDKLGFMMGLASLITAMAPAVGPSIGGLIVSNFGWRMIFVALLPLLILSLLVVSVIALAIFYRRSTRATEPLIDVKVFGCLPFTLSVLVLVFIQFICLGLGFLIPNYAQIVSGQGAFVAGCLLLPGCLLGAALSPISGRILDRFGAMKPILTGNVSILIALCCFSIFAGNLTTVPVVIFYLFFAFGQGFSVGNSMTNGLRQLPPEKNADGNAVINTLQQLAGAIGTSVVSTLVASAQTARPDDMARATMEGSRSAFYLLTVLAVAVILCSCGVFFAGRKKAGSADRG